MHIPLELVQIIIEYSLYSKNASNHELAVSIKPDWKAIQPLTLASKTYRALALEAWFQTLFINSPNDLENLRELFPGIARSIRVLHCVQNDARYISMWDLTGLNHLSKIRLDWLSRRMMPHYRSKDPADRLPFTHIPSFVTELDIRGLPWPSPMVFHNIESILPNLKILRLRQQRIWCGLCHTCSVARFKEPGPERIIYEGGGGLPIHYARALRSLQHLRTVSITIADFGSGKMTVGQGDEHNRYLWSGECDRCMEIMYDDDDFRDRYVARKKGVANGDIGHAYVPPPGLNRVEWHFWRAEGSEEVDVQESEDEMSDSGEE
ncbi:hypothetical protein H0H81_011047 [Sphagnurus paluster]|uniref:Uncharacterized protein n=1 Tax=Sphagnurus paluster TaxID=117069 RepID=A0A9P7FNP9_9AGAR|nr:hypothetical protein H0H81_011047 [Sphagnurus paluster]